MRGEAAAASAAAAPVAVRPFAGRCGRDAIHDRHQQVHQDHVRFNLTCQPDCFSTVTRLADDLQFRV